jgi:hypothetical protein
LRHRCMGNPATGSSCLLPPVGAIVCFGYLDPTGNGTEVSIAEALDREPQPIVLPVCWAHRRDGIRWAADLWSHIAGGLWVDSVDEALEVLDREGGYEPVSIAPDPSWAVKVEALA